MLSSSDSSGAWISSHLRIQVRSADECVAPGRCQPRETRWTSDRRLSSPETNLKVGLLPLFFMQLLLSHMFLSFMVRTSPLTGPTYGLTHKIITSNESCGSVEVGHESHDKLQTACYVVNEGLGPQSSCTTVLVGVSPEGSTFGFCCGWLPCSSVRLALIPSSGGVVSEQEADGIATHPHHWTGTPVAKRTPSVWLTSHEKCSEPLSCGSSNISALKVEYLFVDCTLRSTIYI